MAHVTIRQALEQVAESPALRSDNLLVMPVYEAVARKLYQISGNPSGTFRGQQRAVRAHKIIANRLAGLRMAGTLPVHEEPDEIEFLDLTGGTLES